MKQAPKVQTRFGRSPEKGAIAVELALMLPLLLVFFVGIVDMGLLIREHQILQNAAREGARMSSLPRNQAAPQTTGSLATIQDRVVDYLAEEGITIVAADVTVSQNRDVFVNGVAVSVSDVSVSYVRAPLIGLLSGPVSLSAQATFRNLYP
jgi:Flp pilus assembly protein TadG